MKKEGNFNTISKMDEPELSHWVYFGNICKDEHIIYQFGL